jgi:hypothetical protein
MALGSDEEIDRAEIPTGDPRAQNADRSIPIRAMRIVELKALPS